VQQPPNAGGNYTPSWMTTQLQQKRFQAQVNTSIPLKKQLWQQIIHAKILGKYS
jgi:hypothetical protein